MKWWDLKTDSGVSSIEHQEILPADIVKYHRKAKRLDSDDSMYNGISFGCNDKLNCKIVK